MALAPHDYDMIRPRMSTAEADSRFQEAADMLLDTAGVRVLNPTTGDIRHHAAIALENAGITSGPYDILDTVREAAQEKYILREGEIR